jgi:hypothetical protein
VNNLPKWVILKLIFQRKANLLPAAELTETIKEEQYNKVGNFPLVVVKFEGSVLN